MRKKCLKCILVLCTMILALPLCGCTNNKIDTDGEIQGNEGLSMSYLAQEKKNVVINVFNFDQQKVVKRMQSNANIVDNGFCPVGISYYNPIERKTLLLSNNEKPEGYQVYLQDQTEIKKLGLLKSRCTGAVFHGNELYAIVYQDDVTCEIHKYTLSNLDRPLQTWRLMGDPQKILLDHETKNVYVLCAERGKRTVLTRISLSGDCTHKELFAQAYHLDATIANNCIGIACNHILGTSEENSTDSRDVFVYNLRSNKVEKAFLAEYSPKKILLDGEGVYLISRKNITDCVERVNWKTGKREKTTKLPEGTGVFGFVANPKGQFIFTNTGILCLKGEKYNVCVDPDGPMDQIETKIL